MGRKLLQLNCTANWGSTGKIAEGIGLAAMEGGWKSYIAYGRYMNPSESTIIRVGDKLDVYRHYTKSRFLDSEGLGSRKPTKDLIKQIEEIKPDIIHLHNIHDHWLNYPILFDYLAKIDIPIVWTFHDCWAFTGGCAHFVLSGCEQWQTQCGRCPFPKHKLRMESRNHRLRIETFAKLKDRLHIVSVSSWLDGLVANSRLKELEHTYIYNGIDTNIFRPKDPTDILNKYNLGGKNIILGVSSVWPKYKGLDDFKRLSQTLDDTYRIVLIGLPKELHRGLPVNIIPIERTQDVNTLVEWYSAASVVVSLSKAETFGLSLAEGLSCGTPSVGYNLTAIKEIIHPSTGVGVEPGDLGKLKESIEFVVNNPMKFTKEICRDRAVKCFNKDIQFGKYVDLYEQLIVK